MNKVRNSNLELYRIIVMLSIVAHHYVVNSGLGEVISDDTFSSNSSFFCIFGMWGKTGINCFVQITGYFMCQSQITLRKFLKLILQIEFYSFVLSLLFLATGEYVYSTLNSKGMLVQFLISMLPIRSVNGGFTSCFLLFWLTIPFLNKLIHHINQRMHLLLISLCLFTYTFMLYIPGSIVSMNYVSWFIVLYFISSFIRLYPEAIYKSTSARCWGILSILVVLLAIGSVVFYHWRTGGFSYRLVSDSNSILALLVSVTTFMYFKNIKIPHSKFINAVGSTTFGVLLIHANSDSMRQWLWRDIVDCIGHTTDTYYFLYAPIAVLCIFAVCSIIDYVRIKTVEKWFFSCIDKKSLNKNL